MGALLLATIVIIVLAIWIQWYIAKQFFTAAEAKGHYDKKYLWICFWLPVVGYLLIIALPDRSTSVTAASDELPEL